MISLLSLTLLGKSLFGKRIPCLFDEIFLILWILMRLSEGRKMNGARMQHQWFPHSVASCQRYFQKFYHGRIINVNFSPSIHRRSHGVMVSTLDFESSDPSSNLGGTYFYFSIFLFLLIFLLQLSIFLLLNFYFTVFRHKSNELLINTIFYFILIKSGRLPRHADSFPVLSHY